jgi:hypothetical protein
LNNNLRSLNACHLPTASEESNTPLAPPALPASYNNPPTITHHTPQLLPRAYHHSNTHRRGPVDFPMWKSDQAPSMVFSVIFKISPRYFRALRIPIQSIANPSHHSNLRLGPLHRACRTDSHHTNNPDNHHGCNRDSQQWD